MKRTLFERCDCDLALGNNSSDKSLDDKISSSVVFISLSLLDEEEHDEESDFIVDVEFVES